MVLYCSGLSLLSTRICGFGPYDNYSICAYLKPNKTRYRSRIREGEEEEKAAWVRCCRNNNVVKRGFVRTEKTTFNQLARTSGNVKWCPEFEVGQKFFNVDYTRRILPLVKIMSPQTAICNANAAGDDHTLKKKEKTCQVVNSDANSADNSEVSKLVSEISSTGEMVSNSNSAQLLSIASLDLLESERPTDVSSQAAVEGEFRGGRGDQVSADTSDQGDDKSLPTGEDGKRAHASSRVAVIGAGAAGLVAARELIREGHSVVMYEQGKEVGGVWKYDPRVESDPLGIDSNRSRVHSSMYPSLRTNLPRELMGYLDYPFVPKEGEGRDGRRFPNHREVAQYLEDFSKDFKLLGLVKFGVKVEYVGPEVLKGADTRWIVKFRKSGACTTKEGSHDMGCWEDETETEVFDAVVVCNGHYAEPRIAHIPGVESWPGLQMHSHNYRFSHPFQDKVVVVIGSANSAQDISKEIALLAKEVHLCARAWRSTEHPSDGKGLQRNIWQHPMVRGAYSDGTVEFEDGTSVIAGVILHCTGYLFSFPFLDTKGYVSVDDNRVGPLYKHVFPPALAPTLSFVGLPWKVVPFPIMELQSRWIARLLSGKSSLPMQSEMMTDVWNLYEQLKANHIPKSYTHNCDAYQFEYVDWLTEQSGHEPPETWRREIYFITSKNRKANPDMYRDEWDDQHLLEVAMACLEKMKIPSNGLSEK